MRSAHVRAPGGAGPAPLIPAAAPGEPTAARGPRCAPDGGEGDSGTRPGAFKHPRELRGDGSAQDSPGTAAPGPGTLCILAGPGCPQRGARLLPSFFFLSSNLCLPRFYFEFFFSPLKDEENRRERERGQWVQAEDAAGLRHPSPRPAAALGAVSTPGHARSLPSAVPLPGPRPGSARWDGERGGLRGRGQAVTPPRSGGSRRAAKREGKRNLVPPHRPATDRPLEGKSELIFIYQKSEK